jgi:hypothetical protein
VELVVVNFRAAGKARRTTFNGRDYLVAPMTLIVPGVVPGSEGPLLYPLEELARNYQAWNYMPIVVNHPLRNGRHVSAREPAILEESGVGFVFNASLDGRLRGEGWFDVERTRRVDARVLDRLERGEPLELSTGLYIDEEAAPQGAVWNTPGGPRPYRAVARNYRPDHLAVLPDQRGACAVDDGCGVLVNARGDQPRVPAGQPGGGRFASVAEAGAAVEKASARVKGAQAALEKAKAALKIEKDGLVTARAGLKEAQAREKAQSPRAKAATAKAKEKAPVDVARHVEATRALSDEGVAGKEVKRTKGIGYKEFQPKLSNEEFITRLDAHVAGMNKTLNKAQVLGVAAALGFPRSTTKKAALEVVRHTILQRRGTKMRSYV